MSARYAGEPKSDAAQQRKAARRPGRKAERRAHFCSVLVLVRACRRPAAAHRRWRMARRDPAAQRGAGGFGYDPLFYVPTHCQTAAELDADIKNRLSHRGQAMQKLIARLPAL
jgi:XTP/dITP diphosphohydrolase